MRYVLRVLMQGEDSGVAEEVLDLDLALSMCFFFAAKSDCRFASVDDPDTNTLIAHVARDASLRIRVPDTEVADEAVEEQGSEVEAEVDDSEGYEDQGTP